MRCGLLIETILIQLDLNQFRFGIIHINKTVSLFGLWEITTS